MSAKEPKNAPEAVVTATVLVNVKLMVPRAGVGFSQNRGDVVAVPQAEAIRMIEAGQAIPDTSTAGVETR